MIATLPKSTVMKPEDQVKLVFETVNNQVVAGIDRYLDAIANLTDIALKHEGIDAEWLEGGSKTMLKLLRQHDRAKASWLRRYLTDELPSDPLNPVTLAYRPHAEASLAKLRIAQEVLDRDPDGWAQQLYGSAAQWWMSGELIECKRQLKELGILDRPSAIGKVVSYKQTVSSMDFYQRQINGCNMIGYEELKQQDPEAASDPMRLLFLYAAKIAHSDAHFNSLFYQQQQAIKRASRAMQQAKALKSAHVSNSGELEIAQKGKGKRKTTPKKGGFSKET